MKDVNRLIPQHHKLAGLNVKTSNLCSEITLPTGIDKDGKDRTAVCCLSSLNLETYDEWKDNKDFVMDVMKFSIGMPVPHSLTEIKTFDADDYSTLFPNSGNFTFRSRKKSRRVKSST